MVAGQRRWRRERRRLTGSTWCRPQWGTSFESIILDRSFRATPLPRKQTIDGAKLGPGNELRIACRQSGPRDQYQRADPDGCNNKRCDQSIAEPSPTSIQQTPATLLPRVAVLLFFVSVAVRTRAHLARSPPPPVRRLVLVRFVYLFHHRP